jgi:regulator of RNase E activity RraA
MSSGTSTSISLASIRESLYTAVVCDALDSLGHKNQSPRVSLVGYSGAGKLLAGRCKTTLWADMYHDDPKPYALELAAVDSCRPDEVLICAAGGSVRSALWGELLSTAVRARGGVGAIVDGATRDIAKLRAMQFPVYARAVSPYDSKDRQRVIDMDVAVQIDGITFEPGDLVLADEDGVVVVPNRVEAEAIQRAWDKVHLENKSREAIQAGMLAGEAFRRFGIL